MYFTIYPFGKYMQINYSRFPYVMNFYQHVGQVTSIVTIHHFDIVFNIIIIIKIAHIIYTYNLFNWHRITYCGAFQYNTAVRKQDMSF